MDLEVERVDVWAAPIQDKTGSLAALLKGLQKAGADLQFVIARRSADTPGTGVVFVTPLRGEQETRAASKLGFNVTQSLKSIRVRGLDRAGIVADLMQALADGEINLRGLSASVIGSQFIAYVGVDTADDVTKAIDILGRL
jgi:predicted amino acid-binding ACT domain protein